MPALASGTMNGSIRLYDIRSDSLIQHYPPISMGAFGEAYTKISDAPVGITSLSFHQSGNYLLSSCVSGSLNIWDIREGKLLHAVKSCDPTNRKDFTAGGCAAFSTNGSYFASDGSGNGFNSDRNVMVWKSNLRSFVGGCEETEALGSSCTLHARPSSAPCKVERNTVIMQGLEQSTSLNNRDTTSSKSIPGKKTNLKQKIHREYVIEDLAGDDVVLHADELDGSATSVENAMFSPPAVPITTPEKEKLPEILVGTLDHIVGQLGMLTQTLAMIDKRLAIQEDTMAQLLAEKVKEKMCSDENLMRSAKLNKKNNQNNITCDASMESQSNLA